MFANIKRIIGLILLTVLLCASGTAMAYSGSDYTTNSSLATKLDNLINGKVAIFSNTSAKFPVGSKLNNSTTYYWASGSYSGKQCYAYGQAAYYYLFGDVPYHGYRDYSYSTTISGVKAVDNLSYDVFIQKGVGCGAYIRTTANSDGSYNGSKAHSMIVLTYDKSNITILHGNADGNGLVTISTYTWAKFNSTHISGKGRYVAHIVQPDLTAFSLSYTSLDSKPRIAVSDATSDDPCRLQSAPYDQRQYDIKLIEKNEIVYIKGAVENSYGNTWYCIVDTNDNHLGYIWEGDLELKEDNATYTLKQSLNLMGVVKTADGWLKDKPYEASDHHGRQVAKGNSVTLVASYTNCHQGHIWYKTDEGYFIYSGDVTTYVSEDLFHIKATFKNTEKRASHVAPYLDSDEKNTIKKDANVTVTKFVTNSHGNIWAQLEDGSYLCFYDKETGENKLKFVSVSQKTTVDGFPTSSSDSGYPGYPTGDRDPKTSCALRGTIKSVAPMLSIEARVTNLNTNKEVLSVTAKPKYDLRSAKINSDITNRDGSKTNINNKMSFSKVADDGHYVYEIAVQHGFVYEGKTFTFGDETVVFDSTFTIGDPEETLPDVPDTPGGTQIGTTTKLLGDVNDDGKVSLADLVLLLRYINGWDVTINTANADMNTDSKVALADLVLLLRKINGWNDTPEII